MVQEITNIDNIELMHSYPDFPEDAITAFNRIITRYYLKPTSLGIYSVSFDNRHCRINLNMDRYDLQAIIYKKSGFFRRINDFGFGIISTVIYLTAEEEKEEVLKNFPKTSYGDKESIKNLLIWYADSIEKHLDKLLSGKFDRYNELKTDALNNRIKHKQS